MRHKILNGLHILEVNVDGTTHVHVYTEQEYQHIKWWVKVLIKYNFK